jgi:hypothetical protein
MHKEETQQAKHMAKPMTSQPENQRIIQNITGDEG